MNTFGQLLSGAFIGIFIVIALIDTSPTSHKNIVENALKECEKSLPRDQHCTIVAIPPSKD